MARGNDIADAIRRELKRTEQLTRVAEVLDEFGSLENAIDEARNQKAHAESERDKVKAELAKLEDIIEADTKLHNERLREQADEVRKVITDAKEEATEIRTKARAAAMKSTEAAKRAAQKIQDENNLYLLEVSEKRGRLDSEVVELEKIKAQVLEETAEWVEKLEETKARIRTMMEG